MRNNKEVVSELSRDWGRDLVGSYRTLASILSETGSVPAKAKANRYTATPKFCALEEQMFIIFQDSLG